MALSIKPPRSWIQRITIKYPARVRILDCKALEGKEGVEELFEIISDKRYTNNILKDLKEDTYLSDIEIISSKDGRILGSVKTHKCTACKSFAFSNCFLISVSSEEDGFVEWVILSSEEAYKKLLRDLEEQGVEVMVKRISRVRDKEALTARQEEILQIALEMGYFEYPKSIDLRSLASRLDISPSTLSELLRKSLKKVLKEYFKGRVSALSRQARL
ncbi:MAG: helix-turn-helix domain-containing protein [Nitrososphaerales archaeon]